MRRFLKGRVWEFGIFKIRKIGVASLDMGQQRDSGGGWEGEGEGDGEVY